MITTSDVSLNSEMKLLTIGGIEMLIAQAERQFETWTGAPPRPGLFREAVQVAQSVRREYV